MKYQYQQTGKNLNLLKSLVTTFKTKQYLPMFFHENGNSKYVALA